MIRLDHQSDPVIPPQRAAAYVRMSTEHQQYSTCNQMEVINGFARQRNLAIEKVYSDEGKSGLRIKGRAALSQMIGDVLTRKVNYSHILVYDISRWGRFQDPDEAAHYEFICREAGVTVHYCAEQFENDGGLTSTIAKSFKRVMAGEFSRELSTKVFQGAARMIRMGFKQGGTAVFGLRRVMVDQNGQHKIVLKRGDRKSLQTDRVIMVPGPEAEIEVVRWIFAAFVEEGKGETEIARLLNEQGVVSDSGVVWTNTKIRSMLQNEKYIGNLVYARSSSKLRSKPIPNPPAQWIRKENVFEGIVAREKFFAAQDIYQARGHRLTNEEMLQNLRGFLDQRGHLTCKLLNQSKASPTASTFKYRFGGMVNAYRLIGFQPRYDYRHLDINRRLFNKTG